MDTRCMSPTAKNTATGHSVCSLVCMSRVSTSGAGPKQVLTRLLPFGAWHRHAGVLKGHLIPI